MICEMRSGLAQPFRPASTDDATRIDQTRLRMTGDVEPGCRLGAEASITMKMIELAKKMEELRVAFVAPASRRGGYIRF